MHTHTLKKSKSFNSLMKIGYYLCVLLSCLCFFIFPFFFCFFKSPLFVISGVWFYFYVALASHILYLYFLNGWFFWHFLFLFFFSIEDWFVICSLLRCFASHLFLYCAVIIDSIPHFCPVSFPSPLCISLFIM